MKQKNILILDTYIAKEFLTWYFVWQFLALAIFIVSDMMDQINMLLDTKTGFWISCQWFFFRAPDKVIETSPIAVLLGCLLSIGSLVSKGELTAMKAGGMSLYRITMPVLILSTALSFTALLLNEFLVPYANRTANYILKIKIHKNPEGPLGIKNNLTLFLSDSHSMFFCRLFDGPAVTMHQPIILKFNESWELSEHTYASIARWVGSSWHFYNGAQRDFKTDIPQTQNLSLFNEKVIDLSKAPSDLGKPEVKAENMNLAQINSYIKELRKSGLPYLEYLVDFHFKFARPFANLVVALLGVSIPFLFHRGRTKFGIMVVMSLVATLIVIFCYYGLFMTSRSLSLTGVLSPTLGPWFANILFTIAGVITLVFAKK